MNGGGFGGIVIDDNAVTVASLWQLLDDSHAADEVSRRKVQACCGAFRFDV